MRHEKLFEPVDGAEPCGPDLDEVGDEEYLNYVLPAEDRLPARFTDGQFYGATSMEPFDRNSIDLKSEVKTIAGLLARSRDLRLLTLEARFQIAAGQLAGFAESIQAMAGLVGQYWETVHPLGFDGDFTLRQNTLASLDDRAKVILPMQFAAIVRDKRLGVLTYRHYAIASGEIRAREGEAVLAKEAIVAALGATENRAAVEATYATLTTVREGLDKIRAAFVDAVGYDYAPNFDGIAAAVGKIAELIEKGIPTLAAASPRVQAIGSADPEAGDAGATGVIVESAAPIAARLPNQPAVAISGQQEAAAALLAAEAYFSAAEPSAPALILVRQARLLIGKPLIVALEALAPQSAEQALIRFDGPFKFQIDIARMRLLTGEASGTDEKPAQATAGKTFEIASRSDAAALLAGVEAYFRAAEPSSPVPMLLAKARSFMNQDFLAILKDLIGSDGQAAGT
jgi:type VI secretion system protein ImpA